MAWALVAEVGLFAMVVVLLPDVVNLKVLVFELTVVTLVDLVSKLIGELVLVLVSELDEIKALSIVAIATMELV